MYLLMKKKVEANNIIGKRILKKVEKKKEKICSGSETCINKRPTSGNPYYIYYIPMYVRGNLRCT